MAGALLRLTAAAALLTTSCCFVAPRKTTQKVTATRAIFDDDDGSIWDTLFRYGPLPTGIRVFRPEVYEEKVNELMETTGRTRLEAQRATDFYFNDPNGFGVQEIREIELGEKVDYSRSRACRTADLPPSGRRGASTSSSSSCRRASASSAA
ncbi:hypothetical protein JL721_2405 [Aureococcus anophagefferens]|nr:hypothetical protein JL721_2405 [Aureococcus anophagefferens]